MQTFEDPSPTRYGLKRSEAMDFDNIDDNITFGTLKSEDSGIVLLNSLQSPDDDMRDITTDLPSPSDVDKLDSSIMSSESTGQSGGRCIGKSRRRSSAGTYSSAEEDDDDGNYNGGRGARRASADEASLSDDDNDEPIGKRGRGNRNDLFLQISDTATGGKEDNQFSTDSSNPADDKNDSSPEREEREPPKIEEPRVDFTKGLRCSEVTRAIEILKTRYRLPDVRTSISIHPSWSVWGKSDYSGRTFSRLRHHHQYETAPEGSKELKEICQSIEQRHREIAHILQKLLELDAANQAEADALLRLAGSKAAGDSEMASPDIGPVSAAAAVNPSLTINDHAHPTVAGDSNAVGPSRSLKRRNPFSRAVSAIRKRFAPRSQQPNQPVPVAA